MKIYGGYVKCQRQGYTPALFAHVTTAENMQEAIGKSIEKGRKVLPASQGYENHTATLKEVSSEMIDEVSNA